MKEIPDYLHSTRLENPKNNEVFQHTYKTIHNLGVEFITLLEHMDVSDGALRDYVNMYISKMEEDITSLVNLTIDRFEK